MYALIFWETDSKVKPVLNGDGTLVLFNKVEIADEYARTMENISKQMDRPVEMRVISIEGVEE